MSNTQVGSIATTSYVTHCYMALHIDTFTHSHRVLIVTHSYVVLHSALYLLLKCCPIGEALAVECDEKLVEFVVELDSVP